MIQESSELHRYANGSPSFQGQDFFQDKEFNQCPHSSLQLKTHYVAIGEEFDARS